MYPQSGVSDQIKSNQVGKLTCPCLGMIVCNNCTLSISVGLADSHNVDFVVFQNEVNSFGKRVGDHKSSSTPPDMLSMSSHIPYVGPP